MERRYKGVWLGTQRTAGRYASSDSRRIADRDREKQKGQGQATAQEGRNHQRETETERERAIDNPTGCAMLQCAMLQYAGARRNMVSKISINRQRRHSRPFLDMHRSCSCGGSEDAALFWRLCAQNRGVSPTPHPLIFPACIVYQAGFFACDEFNIFQPATQPLHT